MRVAIIGKGKMGTLLAQTAQAKGMQVVGLFDITDKEKLLNQTVDLVIDFSHRDNLDWVIDYVQKTHAALVYGTTGLNDEDKEKLKAASKQNVVFYSANYSIGIAVLTKVIKEITPLLETDFDMEIIEKHHNQKKDAPSGTALHLLEAIDPQNAYTHQFGRVGMVGARQKEIGIHAVRGGTLAGEHSVLYLGQDEVLEFTHQATSRQIFVNGAIKAAMYVSDKKAGWYTMEDMMKG